MTEKLDLTVNNRSDDCLNELLKIPGFEQRDFSTIQTAKQIVEETLDENQQKIAQEQETRIPDSIITSLENKTSMDRSLSDWRVILTRECQVYVTGEQYLGKRYDQVHYKYMNVDEAKEILTDNLWAILLYKYFPTITDEVLNRVKEIVNSCTTNLKTFLTRVAFDDEFQPKGQVMKRVPNSAVAFNNGIFDFKLNKFIEIFDKIYIPAVQNTIIIYPKYIIMWNFDFDFEPLPIDINEMPFEDFIDTVKILDEDEPNYCFELFYNMTHDMGHKASMPRMKHLAQIIGYTMIQQFVQYFIMLIGSGQNGKNSLLDGCFSSHVFPRPVSNSLDEIETDKFVTGSLESACHNIFLETSAKTYTRSDVLKALTGSMYQTIQPKGEKKYSGIINCKYIFAGNDQSKIKFSDNTPGFRRRINIFEIFYSWDADHRYMKYGDYFATDFSDDLHEIKNNISNTVIYIYLGMYGIYLATNGFTKNFKFTSNEWSDSYSDIDFSMKEFFNDIIPVEKYFTNLKSNLVLNTEKQHGTMYASDGMTRLYNLKYFKERGVFTYSELANYMNNYTITYDIDDDGREIERKELNGLSYLRDGCIYINLVYLCNLYNSECQKVMTQPEFNDMFKKIYPFAHFQKTEKQKDLCVRCRLISGRLRFVEK